MPYPSAPCQQHKRHSPEEELLGVLESEHGIVILDVILIKQYVNFFTLSRQLGSFINQWTQLTCSSFLISIKLHSNPAGSAPGSCLTSLTCLSSSIGPSSSGAEEDPPSWGTGCVFQNYPVS